MNKFFLITLFSLFFGLAESNAQVIHVKSGGTGNGDSWNEALGSLHEALDIAAVGNEIWVAQGEYFPTTCNPCLEADRGIAFEIPKEVSLYGGFVGTETSKESRVVNQFSILNGDIGNQNNNSDNSYSLLTLEYPNTQNVIDGFIVKNGNADGEGDSLGPHRSGGGIHIKGSGSGATATPIISNCQFIGNAADSYGGAIQFYGGFSGSCEISIDNCHFEGNFARERAGAIQGYAGFEGSITGQITNSVFRQNDSEEGGAIFLLSSSDGIATVNFDQNTFSYNTSMDKGGAILFFCSSGGENYSTFNNCSFDHNESKRGGGIYTDGSNDGISNNKYTNCAFLKNESLSGGAAIFSQGSFGESSPFIQNCVFRENYSIQSGGALFNSGVDGLCSPVIDKCQFINNETTMYGAGMYNFGKTGSCSPLITNTIFVGNISDSGSSVYNYGGQSGNSNPRFVNCTFTKNHARVGPCIYNQASDTTGSVKPFVTNCIFWENIATSGFGLVFQNGHAEPTIQYSIIPFDDCDLLNTQPNSTLTCGPGILFNQNPNFINSDKLDFRISDGSPGIDAGLMDLMLLDGLDLDSRSREIGIVDLGAYEKDDLSPTVLVDESSGNTFCEGETVDLYIATAGTLPTEYQWSLNNIPIAGATNSILQLEDISLTQAGNYHCVITSPDALLISHTMAISIRESVVPELDLMADAESYCAGDVTRTIQAQINNEGFFPSFTWILNDDAQGEPGLNFVFDADGSDTLVARLVSSEICLAYEDEIRDSIIFEEQAIVHATIQIELSKPSYCAGETVTATASIINGGNQPDINWNLNGMQIAPSGMMVELENLNDGDLLFAELNSDLTCLAEPVVSSQTVTVQMSPIVTPTVEIMLPDSLCLDSLLQFALQLEHEGEEPVIAWHLDGDLIGEEEIFTYIFAETGNYELQAIMVSDQACAEPTTVNSEIISLEIVPCITTSSITLEHQDYSVFPNPTTGIVDIWVSDGDVDSAEIRIFDLAGREIKGSNLVKSPSLNGNQLDLGHLQNGMYFIHIWNGDKHFMQSIFVVK